MLALWPKKNYLLLSPSALVLLDVDGSPFSQKILSEHRQEIASKEDKESFEEIVRSLKNLIEEQRINIKRLHVVISNHYIRYAILPPTSHPLTQEEQKKRAELYFDKIYGTDAENWFIAEDTLRFNQPHLVGAMNKGFIEELQKFTRARRIQVLTVEPILIPLLNLWEATSKTPNAWIVCLLHGLLTLIQVEQFQPVFITQFSVEQPFSNDTFNKLLKREMLKQGAYGKATQINVFAPLHLHLSFDDYTGVVTRRLPLPISSQQNQLNHAQLLQKMGAL